MPTSRDLAAPTHPVRTAADALIDACAGARAILFHDPEPRQPARRALREKPLRRQR